MNLNSLEKFKKNTYSKTHKKEINLFPKSKPMMDDSVSTPNLDRTSRPSRKSRIPIPTTFSKQNSPVDQIIENESINPIVSTQIENIELCESFEDLESTQISTDMTKIDICSASISCPICNDFNVPFSWTALAEHILLAHPEANVAMTNQGSNQGLIFCNCFLRLHHYSVECSFEEESIDIKKDQLPSSQRPDFEDDFVKVPKRKSFKPPNSTKVEVESNVRSASRYLQKPLSSSDETGGIVFRNPISPASLLPSSKSLSSFGPSLSSSSTSMSSYGPSLSSSSTSLSSYGPSLSSSSTSLSSSSTSLSSYGPSLSSSSTSLSSSGPSLSSSSTSLSSSSTSLSSYGPSVSSSTSLSSSGPSVSSSSTCMPCSSTLVSSSLSSLSSSDLSLSYNVPSLSAPSKLDGLNEYNPGESSKCLFCYTWHNESDLGKHTDTCNGLISHDQTDIRNCQTHHFHEH